MATSQAQIHPSNKSVVWDWLTTVDHKKIAMYYLISGTLFLVLAGVMALFMRIQLMYPESNFISGQTYNQLLSMHGAVMLFLAATPILFGFMNYIIPLQIGARDVAFPFMNALGFWLFFWGGIFVNLSWFFGGAGEAGWTMYVPLAGRDYTGLGMDFFIIGLQISGLGTLISAINLITTIINMRAPGMTMMRLPLFTWTTLVSSVIIVFAFTPLAVGLLLLMLDRIFNSQIFNPDMGGNVVLYQHIFWIFGHPEVYLLVLPAFGMISEVVATFSRKRLFGYSAMVFATIAIAFLGFMVWAHHMFTVGMGPISNSAFSIMTMTIAVPTGVKVFNWLFTMWGGKITLNSAMLFAASFIPTFVMGGVTGVMMAMGPIDHLYHDTYFIVAHFHYVIVVGIVLALFAALFYWYPKMFGHRLNETLGKLMFAIFYVGFTLTFFVQHFLGLMGMQRRVYTYFANQGFDTLNLISSIGTFLMAVAIIILVINIIYSAFTAKAVETGDPWDGRTLEWSVETPVPVYNFAQIPLVRSVDAFFYEKMQGDGKMKYAEKLDDIHMPNQSILPPIIAFGLFIAGLGFVMMKMANPILPPLAVVIVGFVITFGTMIIRSVKEDFGHYIPKEAVEKTL